MKHLSLATIQQEKVTARPAAAGLSHREL